MTNELTLEQYEKLNHDLFVYGNGRTNKKCPICGNDVIVMKKTKAAYTIKCISSDCFSISGRGI